jgi:hypothetical protein
MKNDLDDDNDDDDDGWNNDDWMKKWFRWRVWW